MLLSRLFLPGIGLTFGLVSLGKYGSFYEPESKQSDLQ